MNALLLNLSIGNVFRIFLLVGVFWLFFAEGGGLDGPSDPSLGEWLKGDVTVE